LQSSKACFVLCNKWGDKSTIDAHSILSCLAIKESLRAIETLSPDKPIPPLFAQLNSQDSLQHLFAADINQVISLDELKMVTTTIT